MQSLKEKIQNKQAKLGVIGLGYIGLPLAVEKAKAGFKTIGFDILQNKVDMVNQGHNYIGDVVNEDLEALVKSGILKATSDISETASCDCVCICVPTPLDSHQQPNMYYVKYSVESLIRINHLSWNYRRIDKTSLRKFWF